METLLINKQVFEAIKEDKPLEEIKKLYAKRSGRFCQTSRTLFALQIISIFLALPTTRDSRLPGVNESSRNLKFLQIAERLFLRMPFEFSLAGYNNIGAVPGMLLFIND